MKKTMQNKLWFIQGILIVALCLGWYQFNLTIKNSDACAGGLNYIEYLNSSAQRLAKLEMLESPNDELAYHLNNVIYKLDATKIYGSNISGDMTVTNALIFDLQANWKSVFDEIVEVREGKNASELLFASERFYNTAIQLTLETSNQFTAIAKHLSQIQLFLICVIVLMLLTIVVNIFNIFKELKVSRALSEKAFIDASTGLFNRSKCQEMLKSTTTPATSESRIMVVIDLNDLKIANDKFGHQIGDELISNFANVLKEAAKVHNDEIFIGRYGGDEFMVYYPSAKEADVLLYLEEIDYLCDQFNLRESRYQISYAAGYAVFGEEHKTATMRELFNKADTNMYDNKVKMKRQHRNQLISHRNKGEILADRRAPSTTEAKQVATDSKTKGGA